MTTPIVNPASWSEAILTYLRTTAGKHVFGIALVVSAVFVGRVYLQDHDARIAADAAVKTAQSTIDGLKAQQAQVGKVAQAQVIVLKQEAATIRTPTEAVTALTTPATAAQVDATPLNVEALPDAPTRVSVDALPFYGKLSECAQDTVNLSACSQELTLQKQITAQKDVEITALKKKPSFLHRLGKAAKIIGCAGAGAAAGSLAGVKGAAIGGAAGAGICQAF